MKKNSSAVRSTATRGVLLVATLLAVACSKETSTEDKGIGISNIQPAANDDSFRTPFDATPDPKGENVYFTALTKEGIPAVLTVPAKGGPVKILHQGEPLASPFGIAISEDGQRLFIADGSASPSGPDGDADDDRGGILTMAVSGGVPAFLGGTAGKSPRGVEVVGDQVYFTAKSGNKAGVYRTGLGGGAVGAVFEGSPVVDPSGIAITKKGVVYFMDSSGEGVAGAAVLSVVDGKIATVKDGLAVGHPAGIALVSDDSAVLVSGIAPATQTDIVYRVELGSGATKSFTDLIGNFQESAGLHRAKGGETYAWADSKANKTGTVYVLTK
jgi:sugar lactone lactonase YvrE